MTDLRPADRDDFTSMVKRLRTRDGYREPVAFGIGLATIADSDGSVLDTWFATVNLGANLGSAAIVADVVGHEGGAASYRLDSSQLSEILERCAPMIDDDGDHPNLAIMQVAAASIDDGGSLGSGLLPTHKLPVITFVADLDEAPVGHPRRLSASAPALTSTGGSARLQPRRAVRSTRQCSVDICRTM